MKTIFLLLLPLYSVFPQYLFQSEPKVLVRIIDNKDALRIIFNDDWILTSEAENKNIFASQEEIIFTVDNNRLTITRPNKEVYVSSESFVFNSLDNKGTLTIKDVPYGIGWWWEGKEDRIYEGEIHVYRTKKNKLEVVIYLPIEDYLKGVVPYEIGSDSPIEALKAQAVAARTEAIVALRSKLYSGEHYDLTSDVECQVFGGNHKRTVQSDLAVELTRGLILTEHGKPINAYYSSNCGGHSETINNVWPDRPEAESYTTSQSDWEAQSDIDLRIEENFREWIFSNPPSYCNPNMNNKLPEWSQTNFRWKKEFTKEEISQMTSQGRDLGNLIDIKILDRGTSGRAKLVRFVFEKEKTVVSGDLNIRQWFSPPLRSSCFVVDKTETGFILNGAGWGHGVGMCQSGAIGMANRGKNFEEILKHYYIKAALLQSY